MSDWHSTSIEDLSSALGVDPSTGLSATEAVQRLQRDGANELVETGGRGPWRILWEQLTATMVLILLAAAVISVALGDLSDAAAIGAIVVLFALLGFTQEYRAEKAMAALKRLAIPTVRVVRDGDVRELPARELVRGDVVLLEAGGVVPADLRLVECAGLKIQEAALTGESEPVDKHVGVLAAGDVPLGDRRNLAFMGTVATYGRGRGVVVTTGMRTELGRIATLLGQVKDEPTPLQTRLDHLGKVLAAVGVGVAALVFVLGLLRDESIRDMLLTAVSIAVAVVPEGLPAVVTITLALGAQRMLRRRALIRKLPAVETLGSVTVICSDKTGTLTENRMTVTVIDLAGHRLEIAEEMHHRLPTVEPGAPSPFGSPPSLGALLAAGALCNDARLAPNSQPGRWHAVGDPTEGALLVAAARFGLDHGALTRALPRVTELPFDSDRKRMTTVHAVRTPLPGLVCLPGEQSTHVAFTKGAVDGLLRLSTRVLGPDGVEPSTEAWQERIVAAHDELAAKGLRVLGLACRPLEGAAIDPAHLEDDLVFVGMVGLLDPPRAEVREAVARCVSAGIRPIMITGDHPLTARRIAAELGIASAAPALTGRELDAMTDAEIEVAAADTSVFARVSPEHKLRIVQALQNRGHVAAMTGDGVNDAPALKRANIGVAMGITGTDVAKEASDMVLLDDNFATIVAAVEEGRTIYDNLKRFVRFSVAGNLGKVLVMVLGPLLGKPLPLTPLQLLWLNLLTDGLLGLGLGVEPPERGVMRRPPYPPGEGVFARGGGSHTIWVGGLIGAVALAVGATYFFAGSSAWQTMVFTTLAFLQIAQALSVRSDRESILTLGLRSNLSMTVLALLTLGLQLLAIYAPGLRTFFGVEPLPLADLALAAGLAVGLLLVLEGHKWLLRRRHGPAKIG